MSDNSELKKEFLKYYEDNLGLITYACKQAGICRTTYYNWFRGDAEFAKRIEEISEVANDEVELALLNKIKDGDTTAIIFFCKCRMKHRGYTERPKRIKIDLPVANTLEEINANINILIEKLSTTEATYEDVQPLHQLLMDKMKAIETYDLAKQLVELRHLIANK